MEEDAIVPADRRLRRVVILAVLLLAIAGAAGLVVLARSLQGIEGLRGDPLQAAVDRTVRVAAVLAWVGGLSFVGCAWWLFHLAHRINRAGRYPPPDMKVIKDTTVRTDRRARAVATAALLASVVAAAAGTIGMWYLYRAAVDVFRSLGTY